MQCNLLEGPVAACGGPVAGTTPAEVSTAAPGAAPDAGAVSGGNQPNFLAIVVVNTPMNRQTRVRTV